MTTGLGSNVEAELAIERLMDKLEKWIVQQPEAVLIWTQPRQARKRAAAAIADIMTNIPTRTMPENDLPRDQRRRIIRALEKSDKDWFKDIEL